MGRVRLHQAYESHYIREVVVKLHTFSPQHYMMVSSTDNSYDYDTLSDLFSHGYFGIL